jgi:hypothetical protein
VLGALVIIKGRVRILILTRVAHLHGEAFPAAARTRSIRVIKDKLLI